MPLIAAVVAAAALVLALAPAAAGAASGASSCQRTKGTELAETNRVRVTRSRGRTTACSKGNGRRTWLEDAPGTTSRDPAYVGELRVLGDAVAYEYIFGDGRGRYAVVRVLDVRRGKQTLDLPGVSNAGVAQPDLRGDRSDAAKGVSDLEFVGARRLAWIVHDHTVAPARWEVNGFFDGRYQVIARGSDVGADSLAFSGGWLYWTDAGQPRSARPG